MPGLPGVDADVKQVAVERVILRRAENGWRVKLQLARWLVSSPNASGIWAKGRTGFANNYKRVALPGSDVLGEIELLHVPDPDLPSGRSLTGER
jgi:hypothetical protein